jgi:peptidoglycan/LPS O-acetylase OafA/YrhL
MEAEHSTRIEYLDWLRAVAAGFVVVGHAQNWLLRGGAIGVSVFFVLSGYLIASILLRDGMMTAANIAKFIVRRIGRIYPMYILQIAVMTAFLAAAYRDQFDILIGALPGLFYFTTDPPQNVGYGIAVLWTLLLEFWFYVTFPFLLWGMLLTGWLFSCLVAAIAVSVAAKIFAFGGATLQFYDHFLIGALCAAAVKFRKVPAMFGSPKLLAAAFCALLLMAEIPYPGSRGPVWFAESLTTAALTGIAIIAGHSRAPTVSLPWLAFLGRISYSTYLMHAVILDLFVLGGHRMTVGRTAIYLPIVIGVSSLTYLTIEQPFNRWVQRRVRFGNAPSEQSAPGVAPG